MIRRRSYDFPFGKSVIWHFVQIYLQFVNPMEAKQAEEFTIDTLSMKGILKNSNSFMISYKAELNWIDAKYWKDVFTCLSTAN